MNILFLTLSSMTGISNRGIYRDLMRKFVHDGHNVYIVVPFERRSGRKTELMEVDGVHILGVQTLNIKKTNLIEKGIATLLLEPQFSAAIRHHLNGIRFDLALYSTPPITFNRVIASVKRKYNAKSYLLLKDIFPQNAVDLGMFPKISPLYWLFRHKERRLYALSDYIGCMSPANVQYVIDHNPTVDPKRVEVCPNSVEIVEETEKVDALAIRRQYGIPEGKVLCIYGGNLGRPQGIDFLMKAIASNECRTNSFFLVVGSGTEFGKIEAWFNSHKPKNAKLLSYLPKEDYDRLMKSAEVGFIFLDRRFTIPNYPSRLLSYLENRIPIMMATDKNTDIGRLAEQNNYGLWVESGNLETFDSKLDTILADSDLRHRMGDNGYKFLEENYTIDKTAAIIMSHFA